MRNETTSYSSAKGKSFQYYLGRGAFWVLIILILLYTLFPFYWAIATSLKTNPELTQSPPLYYPKSFDLSHYQGRLP